MDDSSPSASFVWRVVFGVVAVLALVLGFLGFRTYLAGHPEYGRDFLDLLYYDLQLFVLDSPPLQQGGPFPVTLQVARFAAPAATAYALVSTLRLLADNKLRELQAWRARNHAVVCGGGRVGIVLGQRLRAQGSRVVMVASDPDRQLLDAARAGGLLHVAGDPTDADVLRSAGVARCAEIFVLGTDSAATATTALNARMVAGSRKVPVSCYASISDRDLYAALLARRIGALEERSFHLSLFNPDELSARVLLDAEPAGVAVAPGAAPGAQHGHSVPHVAVAGLSGLGQSLVVELARRWRLLTRPPGEQPWLTVADPRSDDLLAQISGRFPFVRDACRVWSRPVEPADLDESSLAVVPESGQPQLPDVVYVCHDDENLALRTGLAMLRLLRRHPVRIVVRVEHGTAFGEAFHSEQQRLFDDIRGSLRIVSPLESIGDPDVIRRGQIVEDLARALHDSYLSDSHQKGELPNTRESLRPWDKLPGKFKESNRAQARHVGVKLQAVNCVVVPFVDPALDFSYRDGEVEGLARMEHERWMRERLDAGDVLGPRREAGRHPDLKDWDELSEAAQQKDIAFIRKLPGLLADAGFQVLRLPAGPP